MTVTFVYLTGGKPELLVLKAIYAIGQAEVLLGKPELLRDISEFAPKDCIRVSDVAEFGRVVDRSGKSKHARVVRVLSGELIGTDDFLGELRFFRNAGYETDVVPGVSPVQMAASDCGIPLTTRGRSQGFFVMDCRYINPGRLFEQVRLAAVSSATLVLCHAGGYKEALLDLIAKQRGEDLVLYPGRVIIAARRWPLHRGAARCPAPARPGVSQR